MIKAKLKADSKFTGNAAEAFEMIKDGESFSFKSSDVVFDITGNKVIEVTNDFTINKNKVFRICPDGDKTQLYNISINEF